MLKDDPTTGVEALPERIHALAIGGGRFDPHPSAEMVGAWARAIVDVAASRDFDFIAKGKVQTFRKRAEALHLDGIRATAGYQQCEALLIITLATAELSRPIVVDMRNLNRKFYESQREQLAQDFVKLEMIC